ncbi:MAG: R3H domain-containing nucleic acid-binding protein [Cyanobacteria bacterium J06639_1]
MSIDSTAAPTAWPNQLKVTDDLTKLLNILPPRLQQAIAQLDTLNGLIEIVLDLGRQPEARFFNRSEYLLEDGITRDDLDRCIAQVGEFSGDNRAGIESTLHRISAMRNRQGVIVGLTCRVGRSVSGTIDMIQDLVGQGRSLLLLGRPGVGKTTALREIARVLADDYNKRVVIIDTSNEIAGDGDIPHPAIGRARRMQVASPEMQHKIMIEAVENHMPEAIVIDEIGTELEARAARTIAERGVQLVGTAHGNEIANLIKNPTLSDLIGGIQTVTLGDDEARRRGSQKSVLERKALPTFDIAVEMSERTRWVIHQDVANTVDDLLRGRETTAEVRRADESGEIITETIEIAAPATMDGRTAVSGGRKQRSRRTLGLMDGGRSGENWRQSGRMQALPLEVLPSAVPSAAPVMTGEDFIASPDSDKVTIYPYGVSRYHLEQAICTFKFDVVVTKDLDRADVILALRSHVRNRSKIQQLARSRQIPIHAVKGNTLPQLTRALRRILQIDEPAFSPETDLDMFAFGDSEDEMEALEEARLAVEQIVIPKSQPVELLPRSASIRKMQHELVEHYHLASESFGEEPNRRLRIYPA